MPTDKSNPPPCVFQPTGHPACGLPGVVRVWTTWEPTLVPEDIETSERAGRPMCYSHGAMMAMSPAVQSDGGTIVRPL